QRPACWYLTMHLALDIPGRGDEAEARLFVQPVFEGDGRRPIPLLDVPRAGDGRARQLSERRVDLDLFEFARILRRTEKIHCQAPAALRRLEIGESLRFAVSLF